MALGRKTANLLFLQEISLYNVTFSEGQNFLKKKKSVSTAVVWKRECNSLLVKKNGKFFDSMDWICHICRNSRISDTNVVSLLHLLQGQPHYNRHTLSPYYSFCRESHTTGTYIISLLLFIQREPHYNHTCGFCTAVVAARDL